MESQRRKLIKVIRSCKCIEQWKSAYSYLGLWEAKFGYYGEGWDEIVKKFSEVRDV